METILLPKYEYQSGVNRTIDIMKDLGMLIPFLCLS